MAVEQQEAAMDGEAILDREIEARVLARILEERSGGDVRPLAELLEDFPPEHWPAVSRAWLRATGGLGGEPQETKFQLVEEDHDLFGPYRVLRELGRGGQGRVFLAEHTGLGRRVALKVLSEAGHLDALAARRFQREAEVASRLDHPGICTVYESGVEQGTFFIAMQFVEGETLARLIARTREGDRSRSTAITLPSEETPPREPTRRDDARTPSSQRRTRPEVMRVVELLEDLARALHVAHEASVLHRDFKPANVMVTPEGRGVIMDFGLARAEDPDQATLTREGDLMGTPAYMAPEQLAAQRIPVDRRADVWALGVTLYESLTLERPFAAPTREALYQQILMKEPPDPCRRDRHLPRDLGTAIATCLDKDPDRRYQTALDVAEDLRRVREREPILARPAGPLTRILRFVARRPAVAGLILVLTVTVPTIAALATWYVATRPEVEVQRETARREHCEDLLADGFLAHKRQDVVGARRLIDELLALEPDMPEAIALHAILPVTTPQEADRNLAWLERHEAQSPILRRVRKLLLTAYRRGDEARRLEVETVDGRDHRALYLTGFVALETGHWFGDQAAFAHAMEYFQRAVMAAPRRRPVYHFALADAAGHVGDPDVVGRVCAVIEDVWGHEARAWIWIGYARRTVDPAGALQAFLKAAELAPDDAGAWHMAAHMLQQLGRSSEALDAVGRAVELGGADSSHNLLGILLADNGRHEEALAALNRAVELGPYNHHNHQNLGLLLAMMGRPEEALAAARRAAELAPASGEAHLGVAECLHDLGRFQEAIASLQRALSIDPDNPRYRSFLAECEDLAGTQARVTAYLTGEVEVDSRSELTDLAQIALDAGRPAAAARIYRDAIALEPPLAPAAFVGHWHRAACAAALAGTGKAPSVRDEADRLAWRRLALEWLDAEITGWEERLDAGRVSEQRAAARMRSVLEDPDVHCLRDPGALATLPEVERQEWQALWARIAKLLEDLE